MYPIYLYFSYLYIIFVMSAFVYGNHNDTKYIDLLPEAEKEEFLNRIARRIIEEIQSKDSPEQSHTEVSDDQLNAHHAYVQDLIKEESENLRNERSYDKTGDLRRVDDDDEFKKDNKQGNKLGDDKNDQHIDLTLRNDGHQKNNNERKTSDDSTFSVIPVKVVYDQDDNVSNQSQTYISDTTDSVSNLEQDNIKIKNSSYTKPDAVNATLPPANVTEGKETYTENTQSGYQVFEEQTDISNGDFNSYKQNVSQNSVENSTQIVSSTDNTVKNFSIENSNKDDSSKNVESSTQMYKSTKNEEVRDNSPTERDIQLTESDTTLMPLTTEINTKYDSQSNMTEAKESPSTIIYVTTVKSTIDIPESKTEIDGTKVHKVKEKEDKLKKDSKINVAKKHLRTRLEISQEYKIESKASHDMNNKKQRQQQYKSKNIREYFVYEVPKEEGPVFVKVKDKMDSEEPYVVPIYNFAPENAYYTAYNQFGVNNEANEVIKRYQFDKEPYLRNGFEIDLPQNYNYRRKEKKGDWLKYSHWQQVLQSKFDNNPYVVGQDNKDLRRKIKRENGNKNDELLPNLSKLPGKILYVPLRKRNLNDYNDRLTNLKLRKTFGGHTSPYSGLNDHVTAVKNFLYQNKKFGYLSPSRIHPVAKVSKRNLEKKKLDSREQQKKPKIDIELDYYFGHYKRNRTTEVNSNEDYFNDDATTEHHKFDENEKLRNENITPYRTEASDCEHGCIEMDLETPRDDFNGYLETLINVLKDMIYRDRIDLTNYDWLLSTVDLKSAIKKLKDLTETIEKGNTIHPLDLRLLNYVVFLHNTSSNRLENTIQLKKQSGAVQNINNIVNSFLSFLRRRVSLPKNKRKRDHKMTNPAQFWYRHYIRDGVITSNNNRKLKKEDIMLRNFKTFLNDLEDNLYELHDAIKHIALITKYPKQNWYKDLKSIYLKAASKKDLMKVILHLAVSRLFSAIEKTAKNAEEDDSYINKNEKEVRRIQEDFIFVLRLLEQFKKIN